MKLTENEVTEIINYVKKYYIKNTFVLNRNGKLDKEHGNYWQIKPIKQEPDYKNTINLSNEDNLSNWIRNNFTEKTKLMIKVNNEGKIFKIKYE